MSWAVFVVIIGVTTRLSWPVNSLASPASSILSLILIGKCGGLECLVSYCHIPNPPFSSQRSGPGSRLGVCRYFSSEIDGRIVS